MQFANHLQSNCWNVQATNQKKKKKMHQRDEQRLFLLFYLIPSAVPSVTEKGCGDGYHWHARRQEQVPKSLAVKFTCRKPLLPLLLSGAYL